MPPIWSPLTPQEVEPHSSCQGWKSQLPVWSFLTTPSWWSWGTWLWNGQGRSLGFWLGLGWHEGRGAQFFLWCCWLLLTNIEQYYLKVFYLAKCPFLWLQKADFVKKKIFFFGCSHQCFWVISFIGTQSRIDETKRKHRLATASFLGFEVLTDLHLSESSSIFFYM